MRKTRIQNSLYYLQRHHCVRLTYGVIGAFKVQTGEVVYIGYVWHFRVVSYTKRVIQFSSEITGHDSTTIVIQLPCQLPRRRSSTLPHAPDMSLPGEVKSCAQHPSTLP